MLDQAAVDAALTALGSSLLKKPWAEAWTPENPTAGYCYVVAEALHHYAYAGETTPFTVRVDGASHWFLRQGDLIIDFTANQFSAPPDYAAAVRCPFFKGGVQTEVGYISRRGHEVAMALGLV